MTSGSPVVAAWPARLVRSTGIVNSTNGASGLENVWAMPNAQPPRTLLGRLDQVQAAGVGRRDPPGLRENQIEQGLEVALGAQRDADPGQLADLAAAQRGFRARPGRLGARRRLAESGAHGDEKLARAGGMAHEARQSSSAGSSCRDVDLARPAQGHHARRRRPPARAARRAGNVERLRGSSTRTVGRSSAATSPGTRELRGARPGQSLEGGRQSGTGAARLGGVRGRTVPHRPVRSS